MISFFATGRIYQNWLIEMVTRGNVEKDSFWMFLTSLDYKPDMLKDTLRSAAGRFEIKGPGYLQQRVLNMKAERTSVGLWLKAADVRFVADGGSWKAARWVIADMSLDGAPLMASGLLQESAQELEVTDGNELVVKLSETGIFRLE